MSKYNVRLYSQSPDIAAKVSTLVEPFSDPTSYRNWSAEFRTSAVSFVGQQLTVSYDQNLDSSNVPEEVGAFAGSSEVRQTFDFTSADLIWKWTPDTSAAYDNVVYVGTYDHTNQLKNFLAATVGTDRASNTVMKIGFEYLVRDFFIHTLTDRVFDEAATYNPATDVWFKLSCDSAGVFTLYTAVTPSSGWTLKATKDSTGIELFNPALSQLLFSVYRPTGLPVLTASMVVDEINNPPAGGSTFNDSVTEALAGAELTDATLITSATTAETLAVADTESAVVTFAATQTEALAASDSESATVTFAATQTETLAATDTESATATFVASQTESLAAADTESATATFAATQAETLAAADTESATLVTSAAVAETLSAADTVSAGLLLQGTVTESLSAAETSNATVSKDVAIAETLAAAETTSVQVDFVASQIESLTAADTVSATGSFGVSLNESLTAADSESAQLVTSGSTAETLAAADTQSAVYTAQTSRTEVLSAIDTLLATLSTSAAHTESLSVADTCDATVFSGGTPGLTITGVAVLYRNGKPV